ncbi:hypothetical protein ACFSJS_22770 [Streptomyces desertarenae]|uniref:Uncharacterized protein n=1 Tax=Streptomyces desertarenae TaxID=2666184 RepID=A0ABW4PQJ8_9ACTN
MAGQFDREAAMRRLGPAAVEAARREVAAAPPLSPEIRARLRALFAPAVAKAAARRAAAAEQQRAA